MDKISKALGKLTPKTKEHIKKIVIALQSGRFDNLDIKKLKGQTNIFRLRKGNIRIIYQIRNNDLSILKIEQRKETTYNL